MPFHPRRKPLAFLFETTSQDAPRDVKATVRPEGERTRAGLPLEFTEELRRQMLWFFATQIALFGGLAALLKVQ